MFDHDHTTTETETPLNPLVSDLGNKAGDVSPKKGGVSSEQGGAVDTTCQSVEYPVTAPISVESLGRGMRKKKASVLLNEYVTYSYLLSDKPSHVSQSATTKSSGMCLFHLDKYMYHHRL